MGSFKFAPRSGVSRQSREVRRAVLGFALLTSVLGLPVVGRAQPAAAADKLKELNVRVRTAHYALSGTVSDKTLQQYGQALEFIYREYAAGFSEVVSEPPASAPPAETPKKKPPGRRAASKDRSEPKAAPDPPAAAGSDAGAQKQDSDADAGLFPVLVFGTAEEYQRFGQEYLGGATEHSDGMFIPVLSVLLIRDHGNLDSTRGVLFHEAFHQFMHRYVKAPPMWLNEGLATYYGTAEPTRGGLKFSNPPTDFWKLVRKLITKNEAIPLADVVQASRAQFYDATPIHVSGFRDVTRRTVFYAEAYTLVHTLLADPTGRQRLRDFVRDLAKSDGKDTAKIAEQYFGPDVCEHMTSYWIKHVESRPENR